MARQERLVVKVYRETESPSWPDLMLDAPLKVGTNGLPDLIRRGRVVCRPYAGPDGGNAGGSGAQAGEWWVALSWHEVTRIARLHEAVSEVLAMDPGERRKAMKRLKRSVGRPGPV